MVEMLPVRWDSVYPTMATGDLMLSSGDGAADEVIKLATGGKFSHAGLITRAAPSAPALYWEESMVGRAEDPMRHDKHPGAQLGDLLQIAQLMEKNDMEVFYVKLVWDRPENLAAKMDEVLDTLDGHLPFSYGKHGEDMVIDYIDGHYLHRFDHPDRMFCSELVAATFQRLGLLPDDPPPNWYSPSAFTPELGLADGARFEAPVPLTVPAAG